LTNLKIDGYLANFRCEVVELLTTQQRTTQKNRKQHIMRT
jgi:hypothetical protein